MSSAEFDLKGNLLVRARHDSDLIKAITELAEARGITTATFTAIGAVKNAKLGFYDQVEHKYGEMKIDTHQEIASCIGNVTLKDGKPFVHAHAVLADENGRTIAGHLIEAAVFAAEIHLCELEGTKLERKFDEKTGLSLWKIE